MKAKSINHYSRFTDECPSIAERVIRTVRNLIKKPVFEEGNADWLGEIPTVIIKYKNTIHNSTEMKPIDISKKSNEKEVYSNLKGNRGVRKQKFNLGQLVRTAATKKLFSKRDSTNYGWKLYTKAEVLHNTIPS